MITEGDMRRFADEHEELVGYVVHGGSGMLWHDGDDICLQASPETEGGDTYRVDGYGLHAVEPSTCFTKVRPDRLAGVIEHVLAEIAHPSRMFYARQRVISKDENRFIGVVKAVKDEHVLSISWNAGIDSDVLARNVRPFGRGRL